MRGTNETNLLDSGGRPVTMRGRGGKANDAPAPLTPLNRADRMHSVDVQLDGEIATVVLERGRVNALNPSVIEELSDVFTALQKDASVSRVVLTGRGKFFSFGFDVPEFISYTRAQFTTFLTGFT